MLAEIDATLREADDSCEWGLLYSRHVTYLRGRIADQGPPAQRVIESCQLEIERLTIKYRRATITAGAGIATTVSLLLWILLQSDIL